MKRIVSRIIYTIIVLVILLLVFGGIYTIKDWKNNSKQKAFRNREPLAGVETQDHEEYLESLKEIPSDIPGMSKYDKYEMGLYYQDGSDTDQDGLTDQEEIEIYKSDPLKPSTSDDLYSDRYKVEHALDLEQKYEYVNDRVFSFNECSEVILTPTSPLDFDAVVKATEDEDDISGNKVFKKYRLYHYTGPVEINLTDLLEREKLDLDKIQVIVNYEGNQEIWDFTYEINNIIIDNTFVYNTKYDIYITEKNNLDKLSNWLPFRQQRIVKNFNGKAIILSSPIFDVIWNLIFGKPLFTHGLYCFPDDENAENVFFTAIVKAFYYEFGPLMDINENFEEVSQKKIDLWINILRHSPLAYLEVSVEKPLSLARNFLFAFQVYEPDYTTSINNVSNPFVEYIDALPFPNFGSVLHPFGNCAGISHLTSTIYNTGSFPSKGSYYVPTLEKEVTWDLTTDDENDTLTNPVLFNYKDSNFVREKSNGNDTFIDMSLLSEGEEEFVNMLGCISNEANKTVNCLEYELTYPQKYDFSLCEKMMQYIDKGKILDLYIVTTYGGHAVNVYDYKWITSDELVFYVYDSNYPMMYTGLTETPKIFVEKYEDPYGNSTFDFLYQVPEIEGYTASSFATNGNPYYYFVPMDENWKVYNDQ